MPKLVVEFILSYTQLAFNRQGWRLFWRERSVDRIRLIRQIDSYAVFQLIRCRRWSRCWSDYRRRWRCWSNYWCRSCWSDCRRRLVGPLVQEIVCNRKSRDFECRRWSRWWSDCRRRSRNQTPIATKGTWRSPCSGTSTGPLASPLSILNEFKFASTTDACSRAKRWHEYSTDSTTSKGIVSMTPI